MRLQKIKIVGICIVVVAVLLLVLFFALRATDDPASIDLETTGANADTSPEIAFEMFVRQTAEDAVKTILQPLFDDVRVAPHVYIDWGTVDEFARIFESPEGPGTGEGLIDWIETIDRNETGFFPAPGLQEAEYRASFLHNMTETITTMGNIPGRFIADNSSVAITLTAYRTYYQSEVAELGLLDNITWLHFRSEKGTGSMMELENRGTIIASVQAATGITNVQIIAQYRNIFVNEEAQWLPMADIILVTMVILFVGLLVILFIRRAAPEVVEEFEPELTVEEMLMPGKPMEKSLPLLQPKFDSALKDQISIFASEKPENVVHLLRSIKDVKKAATLLIALGPEKSASVFRYFTEDEIEAISTEISNTNMVTADTKEAALNEFYQMCLAQQYIIEGGTAHAKQILEKALGEERAAQVISKLTTVAKPKPKPFDFIKNADADQILGFIQSERPQVIALILSCLRPRQASRILAELNPQKQADVARRIALMNKTSPDIINQVEKSFEKKLADLVLEDYVAVGGMDSIVEILNSVDRDTERSILKILEFEDAALSDTIRKKMLSFDSIVNVSGMDIQRVLQEDVDNRDLAIALKGASAETQELVFSQIPNRLATMLEEEMQFMGSVRRAEVEAAQQKIVGVIRKLQDSGEIIVAHNKGGGAFA